MSFHCVTGAGFDITEHSCRSAACYIAQVRVSSLNQYAAAAPEVEIYKKRKKEPKERQHEPADSIIILPEVERVMKETLK